MIVRTAAACLRVACSASIIAIASSRALGQAEPPASDPPESVATESPPDSAPALPAVSTEGGGAAPVIAPPIEPEPELPPPPKPPGNSTGGFLDFNAYPYLSDVDADSVFTLNILAKLPYGFQYFSLTNIGNQAEKKPFYDTNNYYTEQNLRWALPAELPLDLTIQYVMRGGPDNDRLRFGIRWRLDATPWIGAAFKAIYLGYSINLHALQVDHEDGYVWQMEHVLRLDFPYLDRRLYIAGFADHTFNQGLPNIPDNPVVLELQAGVRLIEELYAIAEYRISDYRPDNEQNLGVGAEYIIKW